MFETALRSWMYDGNQLNTIPCWFYQVVNRETKEAKGIEIPITIISKDVDQKKVHEYLDLVFNLNAV